MSLQMCQDMYQLIALMQFFLFLCEVLIREWKECFKYHILSRYKLR